MNPTEFVEIGRTNTEDSRKDEITNIKHVDGKG
jgi:hypothetical protein